MFGETKAKGFAKTCQSYCGWTKSISHHLRSQYHQTLWFQPCFPSGAKGLRNHPQPWIQGACESDNSWQFGWEGQVAGCGSSGSVESPHSASRKQQQIARRRQHICVSTQGDLKTGGFLFASFQLDQRKRRVASKSSQPLRYGPPER